MLKSLVKAAGEITDKTTGYTQSYLVDPLFLAPKGAAVVGLGATGGVLGVGALIFGAGLEGNIRGFAPIIGAGVGGNLAVSGVDAVSKVVGSLIGGALSIPLVILGSPVVAFLDHQENVQREEIEAQARQQRLRWEEERVRIDREIEAQARQQRLRWEESVRIDREIEAQARQQRLRWEEERVRIVRENDQILAGNRNPRRDEMSSSSSSSYSYQRPAVAVTELDQFLLERKNLSNKKRLYQALFDRDEVKSDEQAYNDVSTALSPFFLEKIGDKDIFEQYQSRVICPVELDIPDDPVIIPVATDADGKMKGTHWSMVGYKMLMDSSKAQLSKNRVFNPVSRAEPLKSEIKPDYLGQQLIERVIHRCYQFREINEIQKAGSDGQKAQAHAAAVKRYYEYTSKKESQDSRLMKILGDKGSYHEFISYMISGMDNFVQTFGKQHEQVGALLIAYRTLDKLPSMPVLYQEGVLRDYNPNTMKDAQEVEIVYDAQNLNEQLILIARTQIDKFEAWNKAQHIKTNPVSPSWQHSAAGTI